MSQEFRVIISSPEDAADTGDPLSAAAARTPDATLEALAASAHEAQASAEAARLPMAGLVNAPDAVLAKLETGFGRDSQAKIIGSVEGIGEVFAQSSPRPPEASGGSAGSAHQTPAASRANPGDPQAGFPPHPGTRAAAPTARASLGPALAGLGMPPMGGPAGAARTGVGKVAAGGRGFQEAAQPANGPLTAPALVSGVDSATRHAPPATAVAGYTSEDGMDQGFQAFDERLARVEQTAREHTSQISNRS